MAVTWEGEGTAGAQARGRSPERGSDRSQCLLGSS